MRTTRSRVLAVAALLAVTPFALAAQVDPAVVAKIRDEGLNRSQIPELAGHLTEVIGPRLTASPGNRKANEWASSKLSSWGLKNVKVEPWGEFGRGWERVSYSGRFLTPYVQPLRAEPTAWTGSTNGTVTGPAVVVKATNREELEKYRGKLKNAFVLMQEPPRVQPEFTRPFEPRTPDSLLLRPVQQQARQMPDSAAMARFREQMRTQNALRSAVDSMMRAEGAAALLTPSGWQYGILRLGGNNAGRDPKNPEPLPQLVVQQEQYGQIWRNAERGVATTLELNVQNRFYSDDTKAYNVLAELPGSDKADELVMLGAHFDSWHPGQGATDNAAGSVIMMEALRILKTLNLQPRRTVRIGLWSGEEQGLLGSRAWVNANKALHPKISAYLNIDNGTGKVRGIWTQGNAAAAPIFERILSPFEDLGVIAVRHGNTGGTDHLAFDGAGVPGFNFIQDPIEYSSRTHHSYIDTYDRLVLDDLKQAAVVVATTVYALSTRDEMMPRKMGTTSTN